MTAIRCPNGMGYISVEPTCNVWHDANQVHQCQSPMLSFGSTRTTPHKCPCCDGWGQRNCVKPIDSVSERMETCAACSGSGVIWS